MEDLDLKSTKKSKPERLQKLFDFMIEGNTLPIGDLKTCAPAFKELQFPIYQYEEYQQRACIRLLTDSINNWKEWEEIISKHECYTSILQQLRTKAGSSYSNNKTTWKNAVHYNNYQKARKKWFKEFHDYLKIRMKIIQDYLKSDLSKNSTRRVDKKYSIKMSIPVSSSGFELKMKGREILITSLSKKPWGRQKYSLRALLNYPDVSVTLKIGDLQLRRCNVHEYSRLLAKSETKVKVPETKLMHFIKKNSEEEDVKVYSLLYFLKYHNQITDMLNKFKNTNKKADIFAIFEEFLKDVEEMNYKKKRIPTNTSICFGIGGNIYTRTKKVESSDINFWEILIPKVLISMDSFNPEQDMSSNKNNISFVTLNKFENNMTNFIKDDCVSFECNTCKLSYSSSEEIFHHFQAKHSKDEAICCSKCGKVVEIYEIADKRWQHYCQI